MCVYNKVIVPMHSVFQPPVCLLAVHAVHLCFCMQSTKTLGSFPILRVNVQSKPALPSVFGYPLRMLRARARGQISQRFSDLDLSQHELKCCSLQLFILFWWLNCMKPRQWTVSLQTEMPEYWAFVLCKIKIKDSALFLALNAHCTNTHNSVLCVTSSTVLTHRLLFH